MQTDTRSATLSAARPARMATTIAPIPHAPAATVLVGLAVCASKVGRASMSAAPTPTAIKVGIARSAGEDAAAPVAGRTAHPMKTVAPLGAVHALQGSVNCPAVE